MSNNQVQLSASQMQEKQAGQRFNQRAMAAAGRMLDEWVGEERAGEAKGRLVASFQGAALSAKKPADFYACSPASVANCVAICALSAIMPGTGATALAYLIPRRTKQVWHLTFNLSHRGVAALAMRAGLHMMAVPVGYSDELEVLNGTVSRHVPDIDNPPTTWDDLRGCYLVVTDVATGRVLCRGWMAKKLIAERRATSDSFKYAESNDWAKKSSPWHVWAVEQAMKTTMHYGISRGWAVIDDTTAMRALSADAAADLSVGDVRAITTTKQTATQALGLDDEPAEPKRRYLDVDPEIPDHEPTYGDDADESETADIHNSSAESL